MKPFTSVIEGGDWLKLFFLAVRQAFINVAVSFVPVGEGESVSMQTGHPGRAIVALLVV